MRRIIKVDEKKIGADIRGVVFHVSKLNDFLSSIPEGTPKPDSLSELVQVFNEEINLHGTPREKAERRVKLYLARKKNFELAIDPEKYADMMMGVPDRYKNMVSKLERSGKIFLPEFMVYKKGEVTPIDDYEAKIREKHTTYTSNEKTIKVLEAFEKYQSAVNEAQIEMSEPLKELDVFAPCAIVGGKLKVDLNKVAIAGRFR